MKPSPYQITAFTEAARRKNFSRAAEALGITQSAVTQHVAKLEDVVGTPLFIRRREGLELTGAGRDLFEISERLRTLEELIEERVGDYNALAAGTLTIGANSPCPAMPIIADFSVRYPQIEINFTLMSWDLAMRRLRDRELDAAFVVDPGEMEGLGVHTIAETQYRAFVNLSHPLARRSRISLADLARHAVIVPEDGSLTQRVVLSKAREHGVELTRVIKTSTFPMVKEAVLHGIGVGLMLSDGQFPSRNLKALKVREMQETYNHCLVVPAEKGNLRLVQGFVEAARDFQVASR